MNEELTNYLKSAKNTPKGKNMSNTMKTIIWITQSENTVIIKHLENLILISLNFICPK